jgi:hypothetical protein
VATWAGPFLTERSHCNDSRSYKGGLGAHQRIEDALWRRNPPPFKPRVPLVGYDAIAR